MNNNVRNKPYYPLGRVKKAVKNGTYDIDDEARKNARDHFGWDTEDIEKAFSKLKLKDFASSKRHFDQPGLWVDHYRAKLLGENVYTHFHFEEDVLQIVSIKRR